MIVDKVKIYLKRLFIFSIIFGVMFFYKPVQYVFAGETEIHSIDISIVLNQDGSADITENWNVSVEDITEWYLVQGSLGAIEIQNFFVMENSKKFTYENYWDIDRSIEEKAFKCGIVDKGNGSYELCWGVGSDGYHEFSASYHMTNFVKGFDDLCAFNQRLVNDSLSSSPQAVNITISKPNTIFTSDEVKIWAFGFDGTIFIENGEVVVHSDGSLHSDNYVTVMCSFPRYMFDTENIINGSFDEMKNIAFENSDYTSENNFTIRELISIGALISVVLIYLGLYLFNLIKRNNTIFTFEEAIQVGTEVQTKVKFYLKPLFWLFLILILLFSPYAVAVYIIAVWILSGNKKVKFSRNMTGPAYPIPYVKKNLLFNSEYCRDIPFDASIPALYAACDKVNLGTSQGNVIGAYILKWLQNGNVTITKARKEGLGGILGLEAPSIVMVKQPSNVDKIEIRLYSLFYEASGDDHILQEKEIYKWSKIHYEETLSVVEDILSIGLCSLRNDEYLGTIPLSGVLGISVMLQEVASKKGFEQFKALKGLKLFLKDFTIIDERQAQDVTLWDNYLIVAQIFGIADEVAKQFKEIYPDYFVSHADYYSYLDTYSLIHGISHAATTAANSASSAGDGGSSSSDGGGGSSGGGSGGGGR